MMGGPPHCKEMGCSDCPWCLPPQAQTPVPKKLAQDYAPKYVDAIRVAPAYVLSPGAALPPVGDLFAASPAAPSLPVSGGHWGCAIGGRWYSHGADGWPRFHPVPCVPASC